MLTTIQRAGSLISNGYNVIPVTRKVITDDKNNIIDVKDRPLVTYKDRVTNEPKEFSVEDARNWATRFTPNTVLALVPGPNDIMWLDFDIDHLKTSDTIRRWIKQEYPNVLIRDCNQPRFAIVFRGDESLRKYTTGWSNKYKLGGLTHQIEFSAWIKPITLYGEHRKTGNVYSWGRKKTPMNTDSDEVEILDEDDLKQIFSLFHQIFEAKFSDADVVQNYSIKLKSVPPTNKTTTGGLLKKQSKFSDTEIHELLKKMNGDDRMDWMQMGWALHDHYNGSVQGLMIWNMWSKQFNGYIEGECENQWSQMRIRDDGITMHTIRAKVGNKEKKKYTLQYFIDNFVFIIHDSLIGQLDGPSGENLTPHLDAQRGYQNYVEFVKTEKGDTKSVEVFKLWMSSMHRKTAYATTFSPGAPLICHSPIKGSDNKYWNTYQGPGWSLLRETNAEMVKPFLDHVEYLFGEEEGGTDWFLTWAAQMIQEPQTRMTITPVHVSTHTRTGRGWLVQLLSHLVGKQNSTDTTIDKMTQSGAKKGYLHRTVFCSVPEIRQNNKGKFSVSEELKRELTEQDLVVDVKYGSENSERIYTRFLLQSNHLDCLIIDYNEGRFNIFINQKPPKDLPYYQNLYSQLSNDEFLTNVYNFLMSYKVDKQKLIKVMETKARERMILATKSPTATGFLTLKTLCKGYTAQILMDFISQFNSLHNPDELVTINANELKHLEREFVQSRMTLPCVVDGNAKLQGVRLFETNDDLKDATELLRSTRQNIEQYFEKYKQQLEKLEIKHDD